MRPMATGLCWPRFVSGQLQQQRRARQLLLPVLALHTRRPGARSGPTVMCSRVFSDMACLPALVVPATDRYACKHIMFSCAVCMMEYSGCQTCASSAPPSRRARCQAAKSAYCTASGDSSGGGRPAFRALYTAASSAPRMPMLQPSLRAQRSIRLIFSDNCVHGSTLTIKLAKAN